MKATKSFHPTSLLSEVLVPESIGIRGLEIESSSTFINPPFGRDLSQALANGSAGWIYVAEAGNLLRIAVSPKTWVFNVPKTQQKPTTKQGKVWCYACIHK
jgi:hypothetical protein